MREEAFIREFRLDPHQRVNKITARSADEDGEAGISGGSRLHLDALRRIPHPGHEANGLDVGKVLRCVAVLRSGEVSPGDAGAMFEVGNDGAVPLIAGTPIYFIRNKALREPDLHTI
jgi:hypothetical protein